MKTVYVAYLIGIMLAAGCAPTKSSMGDANAPQDRGETTAQLADPKPADLIIAGRRAYLSGDSLIFGEHPKGDSYLLSTPEFVAVSKQPVPTKQVRPNCPAGPTAPSVPATVWVKMLVDSAGVPRLAQIQNSDNPVFNDSSLVAAMQYRFTPAISPGGTPISVYMSIPFKFKDCK
jgi:hypothetical protein